MPGVVIGAGFVVFATAVVLNLGWLAFQDWIFIVKRDEYCLLANTSGSQVDESIRHVKFYGCEF
jgi:hypothetical protein